MTAENSPHLSLLYKLRFDFRELSDLKKVTELNAVCFASLAGNKDIDISKANSKISNMVSEYISRSMPYIKDSDANSSEGSRQAESQEQRYARYFAYLNELEAKNEAADSNKDEPDDNI